VNKVGCPGIGPRGRPGAIRLLELAGEARGCGDIAGAPDTRAAALAMRDQHRFAEARGNRRGGVADMDHKRAAADRGCDAVDVGAYTRSRLHNEDFLDRLYESFFHRLQWKDESKGIHWKRQKAEFSIETACPIIDGVNQNCPCADRL
jgi:hypothetical protein